MKPKTPVRIVSVETAKSVCPNCTAVFSGVTGALFGSGKEDAGKRPALKGATTMCHYCGALLTFVDDAGQIRTMTAAERDRFQMFAPPDIKKIYNDMRARLDPTKRNPL